MVGIFLCISICSWLHTTKFTIVYRLVIVNKDWLLWMMFPVANGSG